MYKEYRICTRNIGYVQGIYDMYKEYRICTRIIESLYVHWNKMKYDLVQGGVLNHIGL